MTGWSAVVMNAVGVIWVSEVAVIVECNTVRNAIF